MTLHLDAVSGGYSDTLIDRALSLTLPSGQITAIVRRIGTGKTTLARLIAGHLRRAADCIRLGDRDIGDLPAHARARRGILAMPQTGIESDTLSVWENLQLTGADPNEVATMVRISP